MGDNFLLNFSKLKGGTKLIGNSNTDSKYSNTIPQSECYDGYPIPKYLGYGVLAWEVLYSIWVANQTTIGAVFTAQQAINGAPTTSPTSGPANIFIIRHGEKVPYDIQPIPETPSNYNLNGNGIYRACKLIEYVNQLAVNGTPISYIITCNTCPYNQPDPSMRPIQTISMVSFMLNIPIFVPGSSQDYTDCVDLLFNTGYFDGLNVLICWEHSAIQGLCLNILNAAGILSPSRLPASVTTAQQNSNYYGDEYFKQFSPINNICPDGNYLCPRPAGSQGNPFYVDPSNVPIYIGSNSQYYPYWTTNNFDTVYCFKSNPSTNPSTNYIFDFTIVDEPILTCYSSCNIHIGLYQPLATLCHSSSKYYSNDYNVESDCEVPILWKV